MNKEEIEELAFKDRKELANLNELDLLEIIEFLQLDRKQWINQYSTAHNDYVDLQQENKKQKEVIDKIDKYINDYNVFEVFSFPLMKRWEEEQVKSSIDYEFKTSLIKDLKDILKEAQNEKN